MINISFQKKITLRQLDSLYLIDINLIVKAAYIKPVRVLY